MLWKDEHYNGDYYVAEWAEVEQRLAREYPWLVGDDVKSGSLRSPDCQTASTQPGSSTLAASPVRYTVPTYKPRRTKPQLQLPIGYSPLHRLKVEKQSISSTGRATVAYPYRSLDRRGWEYPIGNWSPNASLPAKTAVLRYSIWTNAP